MKKILFFILIITLTISSCHNDDSMPSPSVEISGRTVLVYMVAENSLGYYGFQRSDSTEIMEGRQYVKDTDRMLLFMDRVGKKPTLYRVRADKDYPEIIMQWDTDFCSSDPTRLQEVLDTVKNTCPAQEYGLIMWSHSDGWIPPTDTNYSNYESSKRNIASNVNLLSFGIDSGSNGNYSNNGAQMSIEGIATAIENAQIHLKYIFFDSCLMGSFEVAYALRQVADYFVASPIATPGAGCYYTHELEKGFFSDDPSDICRTYLNDVESEELEASYEGMGLVASCIQTDKLETLASSISQALPYSTIINKQSVDMDTVLAYQAYTPSFYYRPHNYDALQALRNILPPLQFCQVETALNEAINYRGATSSVWIGPYLSNYIYPPVESGNYCGVSMFIPQQIYTENARISRHGDLNEKFKKTQWYEAAGFAATGW